MSTGEGRHDRLAPGRLLDAQVDRMGRKAVQLVRPPVGVLRHVDGELWKPGRRRSDDVVARGTQHESEFAPVWSCRRGTLSGGGVWRGVKRELRVGYGCRGRRCLANGAHVWLNKAIEFVRPLQRRRGGAGRLDLLGPVAAVPPAQVGMTQWICVPACSLAF